ncbi:hypothetical protein [Chromobacterium alticapitis]|uniref:Uncharacterized protein n=1 Tax=Chromobacterium alticapitis TaxID=2073169 RepID=A0A2S5DB52_9NEIS|nr:hypothetical protein [Chromobacterium alticapitis]POZ60293.1 hypothetical protein C2I19_19665 [Chromobacterium alticapitis]
MVDYNAVLPTTWNALVKALCREAPYLQTTLAPDIARFGQVKMASGCLYTTFTTSLLGYNGCPLEFTVSSAKPQDLSCTLDPFFPLYADSRTIDEFARRCRAITTASFPDPATSLETIRSMQRGGELPLRFGSWLGRKYAPGQVKTKVYSEAPAGASDLHGWLNAPLAVNECREAGLALLMIGYYPDLIDSPREYYYQWHSALITCDDIAAVMRLFGCETWFPGLAHLLNRALRQTPGQQDFPHTTYGFSLGYSPDGSLESFTLFTIAASFFGDNRRVFDSVAELLIPCKHSMPLLHRAVAEQIPLQYNVVGFSIDRHGDESISCTFSPQNTHFETIPLNARVNATVTAPLELAELLAQQSASGAFPAHVRTPDGRWHPDENAFVTAQVLRTLDYTSQTAPHIEKALDFLLECESRPHHFCFWPTSAHPNWMAGQRIDADIDDTAIITELLYRFGRRTLTQARQTLTQMQAYQVQRVERRLNAPQHQWAECYAFHTWMREDCDIGQLDCCVNTNVLILIHALIAGNSDVPPAYPRIIQMLNQALRWSDGHYDRIRTLTPYYAHPHEWLTTLEYAKWRGLSELSPAVNALAAWRLAMASSESPLYCRHDGHFLWTSTCLNQFRQLARFPSLEDRYEYLSQ